MKELFRLFQLKIAVTIQNTIEFFKVVFFYYRKMAFAKVDFSLLTLYLFQNPFKISRRFLIEKGEKDIYVYGETPLTTLDKITSHVEISKDDKVFELGSGRSRTCFWLHSFKGCKVVGIEFIPEFVKKANTIKNFFKIADVEIRNEDLLKSDFSGGTVFYLYGTCYDTEFIKTLIQKFKKLPKGTKIITVSYSLNSYSDEFLFKVVKTFPAEFTWGTTDVYLQILT